MATLERTGVWRERPSAAKQEWAGRKGPAHW